MKRQGAEHWSAPTAPHPVRATVRVPGSKSITNRALVLSALGEGTSTLVNPLRSRDTALMVAALRALGTDIDDTDDGRWTVTARRPRGPADIDCGLAGTVMRFVPPVAVLATGDIRLDGDPRARQRPLGTVVGALRSLGAQITGDALPLRIAGSGGLDGGPVTIDASGSSQFVSGLLLAGARYRRGITLRHDGEPVPSLPHVAMTVELLRAAGVRVDDGAPDLWHVEEGPIAAREWNVEPDLSNATPFLAAAAVTGGEVTVPLWPASTTQAGDAIRQILHRMGCDVELAGGELTVKGPQRLSGIDIDLHEVGELTPTVAALATLADGPSRLRGIAHLRGHETDRLAALVSEINGVGGSAAETDDGLTVTPSKAHGGLWHAYADHRMATAGAIVGLVTDGVRVDDIDCTSKTLPGFPAMWSRMLGEPAGELTVSGRRR